MAQSTSNNFLLWVFYLLYFSSSYRTILNLQVINNFLQKSHPIKLAFSTEGLVKVCNEKT